MKFSEIWLREWVNLSIDSHVLHDQLTMAGFQVEEINPVYKYKFNGIVIGAIVECKIHPYLVNKWIITINNGNKNLINIICGKINCRKNFRIVVANIGALLPNGHVVTSMFIGQKESEGILCTYSMLKLNNSNNIIELPEDAPIGESFYNYLNLYDNIININITPNRGDCFSIIGLSREISTINQVQAKKLHIDTIVPTINDTIPVIIQSPKQCPQFLGRIIRNINTTLVTPLKIQEKLRRCEVQPVNLILDVINYVLLELGYPINVFDLDKINQNTIYIRYSKSGETLQLSQYSNTIVQLSENTLVISDCRQPLAIAGVITGDQFDVSCETRNIFLQSAVFNSSIIEKQSRLYNLHTATSIRYKHGIDVNLSEVTLNYVTLLLLKIGQGYAGPITKIINHRFLPQISPIMLNQSKLDKIFGFHIKSQNIELILKNLGFQIIKIQNDLWKVFPPSWRFDISIEEDVISEIIRIYGYDKISPQISYSNLDSTKFHLQSDISLSRAKTFLVDRGYHEIITYSFVNPNIQKLLHSQCTPLPLINPISVEMSVMRLSLWTGLIKTVIYNQNRQQKHLLLFESGMCFIPEKIQNHQQTTQKLMIAGIRSGFKVPEHWNAMEYLVDFYDIKGDVEALLNTVINKYNNSVVFKKYQHTSLHPKQSAAIYLDNMLIGYIGMIHPKIQKQLDLCLNTLMFELSWDDIIKHKLSIKITDVSKFTKNYRDIALIVPTYINAGDIIETCKNIQENQLIDIRLIDVYTGDNIPKGYKSFTIKLTLQSQTHTMQEKEISKITNKYIQVLEKCFHAIIR